MIDFKAAALSAVVVFGAIAGAPAVAQADTLQFTIDEDGVDVGVQANDRYEKRYRERRDRPRLREDRRGDEWDRREFRQHEWRRDRDFRRPAYGEWAPACSPWRAENKARDMGLRHARVVDVDRRKVVVQGRKWGERQTIIFGRSPSCPVRAVW